MNDEKLQPVENQTDANFYFREAVAELGQHNDRRFAKMVSRTVAGSLFISALLIYLLR